MKSLRWVSWNQEGDDCRPVKWPPPKSCLAFWESGTGGDSDDGVGYCTVVALVEAADAEAARAMVVAAWSPGVGDERFNREYDASKPPGDRFPPPDWSLKLKRWPWTVAA